MLHLVAYDIASDGRLRRVARICEDYGIRVEKSVFECDLKNEDFEDMWKRLSSIVNTDVDRVIDYPIGLIARGKIRELGECEHSKPVLTRVF